MSKLIITGVYITEDDLPPIDDADEILSSEPTLREKLRPKLLSFHENRRPPYWGTWRKKSVLVKPRCPFHQDQVLFKFLMLFGIIHSGLKYLKILLFLLSH